MQQLECDLAAALAPAAEDAGMTDGFADAALLFGGCSAFCDVCWLAPDCCRCCAHTYLHGDELRWGLTSPNVSCRVH